MNTLSTRQNGVCRHVARSLTRADNTSAEGRGRGRRRQGASHRVFGPVPRRDSPCPEDTTRSSGPVVAPPERPAGLRDLVAVRLSGQGLRVYRARPGLTYREDIEAACFLVAWRGPLCGWGSPDPEKPLTPMEETWLSWSADHQALPIAPPSPAPLVLAGAEVRVDVVAWCALDADERRALRRCGFARAPGLVVLGGDGIDQEDARMFAAQLPALGLVERDGVWERATGGTT